MDEFYSDLACERRKADLSVAGVNMTRERRGTFLWERISITSKDGADSIGRPIGNYDTLSLPSLETLDEEDVYDAAEEVARELCIMCDASDIVPDKILVAGLGNGRLTPDSLGTKTAELVNATMHVFNSHGHLSLYDCSQIAVCTPGVSAYSGMEASEVIKCICERIRPDVVFAVDALAAKSTERLGKTIQISDTGICPGSGIGASRVAIDKGYLGSPVISIGVPTVINADYFIKDNHSLKDDFFGKGFFLSPKDIDSIASISAKIIATGINQAFGIL